MIGVVLGTGWQPAKRPGVMYVRREKHTYNCDNLDEILDPVYQLVDAGCTKFVLTNASGSVNRGVRLVGRVATIVDHINLSGLPAASRFTAMWPLYSPVEWLPHVVYAQVPGPAFETPAESRMIRRWGADVVGMSTAIEAGKLAEFGFRVTGLTFVANESGWGAGHQDVLAAAAEAGLPDTLGKVLDTLRS